MRIEVKIYSDDWPDKVIGVEKIIPLKTFEKHLENYAYKYKIPRAFDELSKEIVDFLRGVPRLYGSIDDGQG